MPNKHQIQRDFYRKQKEWKESFKIDAKEETQQPKSILRDDCFNENTDARYYISEER